MFVCQLLVSGSGRFFSEQLFTLQTLLTWQGRRHDEEDG